MTAKQNDQKYFEAIQDITDLTAKKSVDISEVYKILNDKFGEDVELLNRLKSKKNLSQIEQIFLSCISVFEESYESIDKKDAYKKPSSVIIPTAKPIDKIFDGVTDLSEGANIIVSSLHSKEQYAVNTQVIIDIPDVINDSKCVFSRDLTPYDRLIFNGICTLIANGQQSFSIGQLFRVLGGKGYPRESTLVKIQKSITKMRLTSVTIDWTEHARMNGLDTDKIDELQSCESIISCKEIKMKINGKPTYGYKLFSSPALFDYARQVKQICTIDSKLMNVPIKMNDELILITQFMVRWIDFNNRKNANSSIKLSYEYIFRKAGIDIQSLEKRKKSRLKKSILEILGYWKNEQFIKDYEAVKCANEAGIVVFLSKQKPSSNKSIN